MGKLAPKTYLEWREPKAYRHGVRKAKEQFSRREKLLLVLLLVSLLMCMRLIDVQKHPKNPHPLWGYPLLVVSFVGIYVTSLYGAKLAYTVKVRENGIKVEGVNGVSLYKYKEILNYSIESKDIDGEQFTVLSIVPVRGKKQSFGIDPAVSLEGLEKILSEKLGQQRDPEIILRGGELKG